MIVGVLALDQVMGFELMIPGQVFGMANLAAAEPGARELYGSHPLYEVRVCGVRPSIARNQSADGIYRVRCAHLFSGLFSVNGRRTIFYKTLYPAFRTARRKSSTGYPKGMRPYSAGGSSTARS